MKATSVYALAPDSLSGTNANGLVLMVQPSGTGSTDFAQGKLSVSYKNDVVSYANVYTSDCPFLTSGDFGNNQQGSFTTYATNIMTKCAIIEIQGNSNKLLEQGEQFAVFLNLTNIDQTNGSLAPYKTFTVGIIPASGAKLTYSAAMPSSITNIMLLTGS